MSNILLRLCDGANNQWFMWSTTVLFDSRGAACPSWFTPLCVLKKKCQVFFFAHGFQKRWDTNCYWPFVRDDFWSLDPLEVLIVESASSEIVTTWAGFSTTSSFSASFKLRAASCKISVLMTHDYFTRHLIHISHNIKQTDIRRCNNDASIEKSFSFGSGASETWNISKPERHPQKD